MSDVFNPAEQYPEAYPDHLRVRSPRSALSSQEATDLMVKLSRAMVTVSSTQERWPQEAFEELITQHPWASKVAVRVQMTAANDEGYGVGYFVLTPKEIPAYVAGASEIGTVTVPILIKNQELFPFDVFAYKGNFYPVSEERVLRILRLRDLFTEQDKKLPEQNRAFSQNRGFLTARDYKAQAVDSLSKLSQPDGVLELAIEVLRRSTSPERREKVSEFLEAVKQASEFDLEEAARAQLQKHAHATGIEVRVSTDGTQVRTLWSSHPVTGRAQFDEWESVPLAKISSLVDPEELQACVMKRHHFISFGEFDKLSSSFQAHEEGKALEAKVDDLRAKLSSCYDLSRRARRGEVPATIHVFQPKDPDKTETEPCSGIVLNIPRGLGEEVACEPLLILGLDGMVKRVEEYGYHFIDTKEPAPLPEQVCYCGRDHEDPKAVFVWASEDRVYGLLAGASPFHLGEEVLFPLPGEGTFTAGPTPGLMSPFVDLKDDTAVLYLPEDAMVGGSTRKSAKNEISYAEEPKPMKLSSAEVSVSVAQISPVSGGMYRIPIKVSEVVTQNPVLNEVEARATLSLLGIGQADASELLKVSEPTQFWYLGPEIGHGAQVVKRASAVYREKMSSREDAAKRLAAVLPDAKALRTHAAALAGHAKVSSDLSEISISSALSLDFLNASNLHRFVDMIPLFEETLSALCALLVASRLGLDDIPEEPIQASVRSLDTILKGLRMIQYTLAT